MAKGNPLMGMLRGKVGDVVFSRLQGEQISRAYNAQVSNPKTAGQALQRAIFATVTHTAMYLSKVVESSFDGYKNGQASRNAFIAENVAILRAAAVDGNVSGLYLNPKNSNIGAPNALKISKGSLGSITPIQDSNNLLIGLSFGTTNIGSSEETHNVTTLADIRKVLPMVSAGSQITFVSLCGNRYEPSSWRWRVGRIVLSQFVTDDSVIISEELTIPNTSIDLQKVEGFGYNESNLEVGSGTGSSIFIDNLVGDDYSIIFGSSLNDEAKGYGLGGGIIVSNYDSARGEWVHSESFMTFWPDLPWEQYDNVLASYQAQAKVASASDWYTEQAQAEPTNTIYSTLNQAFQGQLKANGLTAKAINFEAVNSYGPIVEGNAVFFTIEPNAGVTYNASSLQVLIGETAVTPQVTSYADGSYRYAVTVPFGTANSVGMNVTFNCDYGYGTRNVGFRTTISKIQA